MYIYVYTYIYIYTYMCMINTCSRRRHSERATHEMFKVWLRRNVHMAHLVSNRAQV